ncbi:heme exporter protein CcmD [Rickettsiella endosymbiont of Rhagonycha lignosa]
MKDYRFYLWIAYLSTATVLLINLLTPLIRYYKLLKKKRSITSLITKK